MSCCTKRSEDVPVESSAICFPQMRCFSVWRFRISPVLPEGDSQGVCFIVSSDGESIPRSSNAQRGGGK